MLDQLKGFAKENGLTFSYTIDKTYDAHRLIFTNPETGKRFSYMMHTPELQAHKQNDIQNFIEYILGEARKLI